MVNLGMSLVRAGRSAMIKHIWAINLSRFFFLKRPHDVKTFQSWAYGFRSEVKSLSRVRLFATPWTVAHQAPPSMGFSRHEYWSGLPFLSPGDLPDPEIEPRSPALEADALTSEPPWEKGNSKDHCGDFPGDPVVKNLPANAGDTDLIPGLGRSHMPRNS